MQKANERVKILVKKVNKKTASYLLGMFDLKTKHRCKTSNCVLR